jgi:hypothetical protein
MPSRENGIYKHWYNFIVPDELFVDFSREVLSINETPKIRSEQIDSIGSNGDTLLKPHITDIYFESSSPKTPRRISDLMRKFDGVDVYMLLRRSEATIVQ